MISAAIGVFKKNWAIVQPYAENEFAKFSQDLILIEAMVTAGTMSQTRAKLHVEMQKNSMRAVMIAVEGIGIITVEEAINAVFAVLSQTVNKAVGFVLL